jgi:outer membrane biosynthesis protein TonB
MKPRKQLLNIACAVILFLCTEASAQTAEQLFNPAAKEYIYGNTSVASNLVEQALNRFPDDEKLQKLKKLIEQQKQQKDQQKKNDQQKQDQKKNDDQKNKQDQKQGNKDQRKEQDQQKQNPLKKDQSSSSDQKEQQNPPQAAQPKQAGEMSPQEAQQLLDAMKQNEKDQRANLTPYLGAPVRVDKDW